MSNIVEAATQEGKVKNHNKYRKDKPWDSETIDHWKVEVSYLQ